MSRFTFSESGWIVAPMARAPHTIFAVRSTSAEGVIEVALDLDETPQYASRIAERASVAARIVKMVKPVYPPEAKEDGVEGLVKLRATISAEGKVVDLQPLSGHQLLTPAAMDAVKQWEYQPVMKDGKAVAVITDIDVNFTLAK